MWSRSQNVTYIGNVTKVNCPLANRALLCVLTSSALQRQVDLEEGTKGNTLKIIEK